MSIEIVRKYLDTLSLLQRDKEAVENVILGYMTDCEMKDNEIEVLNKKIENLETAIQQFRDKSITANKFALFELVEDKQCRTNAT